MMAAEKKSWSKKVRFDNINFLKASHALSSTTSVTTSSMVAEDDNGEKSWSKSWSNMLPEILESVSDRLPLLDYVNFRGVCKSWRHAPSGRKEITSFNKKYLWLMLYGFDDSAPDKCCLYDYTHPSWCCTFYFPHLRNATVLESKSGWLLARGRGGGSGGDHRFFLCNLLTLEKIDLPKHKVYSEQVCSFGVPSTSSDFLVVLVSRTQDTRLEISLCRAGNDVEWEVQTVSVSNGNFGATRAVDCFGCNCAGRCNCETREMSGIVYINGTEDGFVYDFLDKKVIYWAQYDDFDDSSMDDIYWENIDRHRQDFLTRFSDGDMSISVSASSLASASGAQYCREHRCIYEITADRDIEEVEETELKVVEAAWVEPKFRNKNKNSVKNHFGLRFIF